MPTAAYSLGPGLVKAYDEVSRNVKGLLNPKGESEVITSDGWDTIDRRKLVNYNHVGTNGAYFHSATEVNGEHQTGAVIFNDIMSHIEKNGDSLAFHQVNASRAPFLPIRRGNVIFQRTPRERRDDK